jgi:hypothetical protein
MLAARLIGRRFSRAPGKSPPLPTGGPWTSFDHALVQLTGVVVRSQSSIKLHLSGVSSAKSRSRGGRRDPCVRRTSRYPHRTELDGNARVGGEGLNDEQKQR